MKNGKVVATDVLLNALQNNTLTNYFSEYSSKNIELYIPYGVRRKVEESLIDENQTIQWHQLIKQSIKQRVVVDSLHKYQLKREFKELYHKLNSFHEKLTPIEKNLISLSFQLGIDVDSNDPIIIKIINEVKTTPRFDKYTRKIFSRGLINRDD